MPCSMERTPALHRLGDAGGGLGVRHDEEAGGGGLGHQHVQLLTTKVAVARIVPRRQHTARGRHFDHVGPFSD